MTGCFALLSVFVLTVRTLGRSYRRICPGADRAFCQAYRLNSRRNTHDSGRGLFITTNFIMHAPYLQFFFRISPAAISSRAMKMNRNRYDRKHSHTAPPIIRSTDITHSTQFGLRRLIPVHLRNYYVIILFRRENNVTVWNLSEKI